MNLWEMVIWASLKVIDQANRWKYVSLGLTLMIIWTLIIIMFIWGKAKSKESRKIDKIYQEYKPILERLIDEIRTKQHDYKNHIQAIYSMAEMDENTPIVEYIDNVVLASSKDGRVLNTNNCMISALLYSKSCEMKSKEIQFELMYDMPLPLYPLKDCEIVEVLCNLIDYARDAAILAGNSNKKITITMKKKDENKIIEVTNTGIPISQDVITNIHKKGYATNSKNKEYRLFNVNKIIKKYCGKIEIINSSNLITIIVVFP